jgi:hypothetical protein
MSDQSPRFVASYLIIRQRTKDRIHHYVGIVTSLFELVDIGDHIDVHIPTLLSQTDVKVFLGFLYSRDMMIQLRELVLNAKYHLTG